MTELRSLINEAKETLLFYKRCAENLTQESETLKNDAGFRAKGMIQKLMDVSLCSHKNVKEIEIVGIRKSIKMFRCLDCHEKLKLSPT